MDRTSRSASRHGWLVVNSHPHKEALAIQHLSRQGFEAYCPMIHKQVRHARRVADVARPLFPSYVFIDARSLDGRWRSIHSTIGVRSLICSGGEPSLLDHRFIEALRSREVGGVIAKPAEPFAVGQDVIIGKGPLAGFVATIIEMQENDRIVALLQMLHQTVRVRVTPEQLSPVQP